MLREVKYLLIRGEETIPDSASKIYEKHETLRMYNANLDLTVAWYNKIRETVLEVEFPLIEGQLADIDKQLERAENNLNWNGDGVWEYIQDTRDKVSKHSIKLVSENCFKFGDIQSQEVILL